MKATIWLMLIYACTVVNGQDEESSNSTVSGGRSLNMDRLNFVKIPGYILKDYPQITKLSLSYNNIKYIAKDDFPRNIAKNLLFINLHQNYIHGIHEDAFTHMTNLLVVALSGNKLKDVPIIKAPNLTKLILSRNLIQRMSPKVMRYYKSLQHLEIQENNIEEIEAGTFAENKNLIYLALDNNPIKRIDDKAFVGANSLKHLHLKNTEISHFPSRGVSELETLHLENVPNLFTLPKLHRFTNLKKLYVTYSMLCCPFRKRLKKYKKFVAGRNNTILCNKTATDLKAAIQPTSTTTTATTTIPTNQTNGDDDDYEGDFDEEMMKWIMDAYHGTAKEEDLCDPSTIAAFEKYLAGLPKFHVICTPEPDAFNPCEDVMGTDVLRAFSWIISVFAIIGNVFQLVVLFHSKQKSVYKLLMYNLGFSNLLMGIYLLVLCCVDAYTYSEFYYYVQSWQHNGGCQVFGFLAVFATSLSVCSLVLITLERFLLIVFALEAGYQMHLGHAKIGIGISWLYSLIVAVLPATNLVSSYSKTAICLPIEVHETISEGYVLWLLIAYLLAFFMIAYCYIRMYKLVKDVRPVSGNNAIDTKVAKRMALIIFSNFLCWLPISLTGLVALYSGIVFNVNVAKFLIVFIFPLNACTNPFLYAIFTKIFREDTLSLLYTITSCRHIDTDRSDQRDRAPSYFKSLLNNSKGRSNTNTQMHLHVQPPEDGRRVNEERNIEAETDFESPEAPWREMIDPNVPKNGEAKTLNDSPPSYSQNYMDVGKDRCNSTRGLLEEFKRQSSDTPCCSDSTMSSSAGTSYVSSADNIEESFADMIGSVHNADMIGSVHNAFHTV